MNNIENEKAYEQLVKRVEELERQIKERPTEEKSYRDVRKNLGSYDDRIKTQGNITIKDNFIIKNRKGKTGGFHSVVDPRIDNVITMAFNKQEGRLNHIFLGTESMNGNNNCSVISGVAITKKDIPLLDNGLISTNNGRIEFYIINEDQLDKNGILSENVISNIAIYPVGIAIPRAEGIATQVLATGKDGETEIGHYEDGVLTSMSIKRDTFILRNLPTADPGIENALWVDGTTLKISLG